MLKLFTPDAGFTWLLTELDPEDPEMHSAIAISGWAVPNSVPRISGLSARYGDLFRYQQRLTETLMPNSTEFATDPALEARHLAAEAKRDAGRTDASPQRYKVGTGDKFDARKG